MQNGRISRTNNLIHYAAISDTGQVRKVNEDAFVILEDAAVFCVADGMGGYEAGEVASASVVESIKRYYQLITEPDLTLPGGFSRDLLAKHPLLAAIEFSHQQLQEKMNNRNMGSTCAAVQFEEGGIAVGHVGDSRVYLLHHNKMLPLTNDHSLVNELLRQGDITSEMAKDHPQRNAILQAIGFSDKIVPDLQHFSVSSGDKLLICSDGLTSMVAEDEIFSVLKQPASPIDQGKELIKQANMAGGRDNITLILIEIH